MGKEKSNGLSNKLRNSLKIRKGLLERFVIGENDKKGKREKWGKEKGKRGDRDIVRRESRCEQIGNRYPFLAVKKNIY